MSICRELMGDNLVGPIIQGIVSWYEMILRFVVNLIDEYSLVLILLMLILILIFTIIDIFSLDFSPNQDILDQYDPHAFNRISSDENRGDDQS